MIASQIGQYQVVRKLGQGGMGVVYLAHATSLDRDVALKFPNDDFLRDESARRRFLAEATAAAALDHPFVCKVYETAEADGRPYIAMEYVAGITLKDRLAQGPIPVEEVVRIATEVVEALDSAHKRGLIHRDLKPSNIMLSSDGHVKVMDFGLAKKLRVDTGDRDQTVTEWTEAGVTVGTLSYMSPEQLRAAALDERSDIFAMGIVLFEMLTGAHPFLRDSPIETTTAILKDPVAPLDSYLGDDAALWQHTIDRMLVKDRNQRYSSIHEVRTDLVEIQQALALRGPATGGGATRRVKTPRPRRPTIAALLAQLVLAAVLFSMYYMFWSAPKSALAFQARDWILVPDFNNQTGDPIFDKSLRTALIVGIQQSKYVNVFPDARIQQTLQRMRHPQTERLDENLASEVAVREGIKGLLVCSISRIGDVYSLTAQLIDPGTRATAATQSVQARGKDGVLGALDHLASRVREQLGESLAHMPESRVRLPLATTSSLDALKAYADATSTVRKDDRQAFRLLQHAVELDNDFALAHIRLGQDHYIRGDAATGEQHFKKALSLRGRLTLRERLWVDAVVEDWRGNREQAVDRYKAYLGQYPDDSGAWFRLGWAQMATLGQFEAAIESFDKVLRLDPGNSSAYINLATSYKGLKKYPEALLRYDKAFELRPELLQQMGVNDEYGFMLVQLGNIAKARSTFESMLKLGDAEKARGHRSLALLDMHQGKYHSAVAHLREAVLLNKAVAARNSELRDRLYLAGAFRTMGQVKEMLAELNEVEHLLATNRFGVAWVTMAGKLFSKAGKGTVTAKLYQDLSTRMGDAALSHMNRSIRSDQAFFSHLQGIVALNKGKHTEALEAFELSFRQRSENSTLESLASAYAAMGNIDEAIRRYTELSERVELGIEGQEHWILAHYELGKLYEKRNDTGKANEHYRKFLNLWKEADADLKPIADTRARLRTL